MLDTAKRDPRPSPGRADSDGGALRPYTALSDCFPFVLECSTEVASIISAHLIAKGGGHAITSESGPRRVYMSKYSADIVRELPLG